MRGGGAGCYYGGKRGSRRRFVLHALTFWGFLLATISTILAAIYQDLLGIEPPFDVFTPPVMFGFAGGVMMILGATGLLALKWFDRPPFDDSAMKKMDYGFILVLDVASVTGMLTLFLRSTSLMGVILTLHLGSVGALFIMAPYGKLVHAVYRYAALVRNKIEEKAWTEANVDA
jgi:citrate/tricarballylate utilization protein